MPYLPPHTTWFTFLRFFILMVGSDPYPVPHRAGMKGRNRLRSAATRSFHTLYIVDLYLTDPLKFQRFRELTPNSGYWSNIKGGHEKIYKISKTYLQAQIACFYGLTTADKYFIDCKAITPKIGNFKAPDTS